MREGDIIFLDREDAGEKLWNKIRNLVNEDSMILAVPKGGVKVALPICRHKNMGMDLIIPKKLRAPFNEEIAIGAVAEDNIYIVNEEAVAYLEISSKYIREEVNHQIGVIKNIRDKYHSNYKPYIEHDNVIIIDDGIATGMTLLAAIRYLKLKGVRNIVIAAPVASKEAVYLLEANDAKVITCHTPEVFSSVSSYYDNFKQLEDEEVLDIIEKYSMNIKETGSR